MAFSTVPLVLPLIFGIFFCIAAVAVLVVTIVQAVLENPAGILALMTVTLFSAGILLCCPAIVGMYLAKLYTEIKDRPKYLVKE